MYCNGCILIPHVGIGRLLQFWHMERINRCFLTFTF